MKHFRFWTLAAAVLLGAFVSLLAQTPLRILAIGNSFSADAVEYYLDTIARADGVEMVIGNLYIGGCSLETHAANAAADAPAYSFRKIIDGKRTVCDSVSLASALADEDWDWITFQQTSALSGIAASYFPWLPELQRYVAAKATNPAVKYALHQTWAYAHDSSHSGFQHYNRNQQQMFEAIARAVATVAERTGIATIIPAGAAIQRARASALGDSFCSDGYHLQHTYGRFTAACVWYALLTGRDILTSICMPASLTPAQTFIAKQAAAEALLDLEKEKKI